MFGLWFLLFCILPFLLFSFVNSQNGAFVRRKMYEDLPSGGELTVYGNVLFTYVFNAFLVYTLMLY